MDINDLRGRVPNELLESLLERNYSKLTPPQELAIKHGLLAGSNMVVASPTASGKTLVAELAMMRSVLADRKKAVYVAPMRALVAEKYEEFKSAYPYLNVAISIGDLDSLDLWLQKYDIIFVSTEKFDSLIRHGIDWLDRIGCIVIDEVHTLGDSSRGPTLEVLIARLRRLCRDAQIIAISATIGNANEIAEWLGAQLVESDYRPVKLERGIVLKGDVIYQDRREKLNGTSMIDEIRVMEDVLQKEKQLIIFYSSKRNAESGAEKAKSFLKGVIQSPEIEDARRKISKGIMAALSSPTEQCKKLSACVEHGAAFHHSGLVNSQRKLIEDGFREGKIKVVCTTTTLGFGVNMPAHTVLVRDTTRYSEGIGAEKLGINEITQLFGRAGRPKYDTEGRALLIAKHEEEVIDLVNRYFLASLEPINSNLGIRPILRTHVLSFIAGSFLTTEASISGFLNETFYGFQYGRRSGIRRIVVDVLMELNDWGFIEQKAGAYSATRLGARVSELYIDPLTAKNIIGALRTKRDEMANLIMIADTMEMKPYVKAVPESEDVFPKYIDMLESMHDKDEYYNPEKMLSTALMLNDWVSEMKEPEIMEKYNATPGSLFIKTNTADWIAYSAIELSKILKISHVDLLEMRERMKYGIKKELIQLVRLKGVGRVRARTMHNLGIRKISDIRNEDSKKAIMKAFGKEVAAAIISQAEFS